MTDTGSGARLGLRERKKARTRDQIREHALRLFLEQGYEATTIQQIAEAADVSPSTLFRYFPTKARLVLPFDLPALVRDAFEARAPDDTVFDAMNVALRGAFERFSTDADEGAYGDPVPFTFERARDAILGEVTGIVGLLAELIGERWDRHPHDALVQAAAGGVVGVMVAAWTADRDLGRPAALSILEVGLQGLEDGFIP